MRLARKENERIDRDRPVVFGFGEKRIEGYEGDTFGSALYAAGRGPSRARSSTTGRAACSAAPATARIA